MFRWIKDFEPLLYDEAGRERVGRWLWFAAVFILVIALIGAVIVLILIPDPLDDIGPLAFILPTVLGVIVLLRRGQVKAASLRFYRRPVDYGFLR